MSCKEISADWAAQRIKGLSLTIGHPQRPPAEAASRKDKSKVIKTLIDTFRYPRRGPGMMWEACAAKISEHGRRDPAWACKVVGCALRRRGQTLERDLRRRQKNRPRAFEREARDLVGADAATGQRHLTPRLPEHVVKAADSLKYRDFLTVVLILKDRNVFDDNWIYIHDPSVKVGPDSELQIVVAGDGARPDA